MSTLFEAAVGQYLVRLLFLLAALPVHAGAFQLFGDRPDLEFPEELQWLNVKHPLTPDDLKGKVVILDFWTYGCINCLHVAEELRRLEDKYGNQLAVIGIHAPKFDNEKNLEALRNIVVRLDRRHPIANDPDWRLFEHLRVRAWPTLVVDHRENHVLQMALGHA